MWWWQQSHGQTRLAYMPPCLCVCVCLLGSTMTRFQHGISDFQSAASVYFWLALAAASPQSSHGTIPDPPPLHITCSASQMGHLWLQVRDDFGGGCIARTPQICYIIIAWALLPDYYIVDIWPCVAQYCKHKRLLGQYEGLYWQPQYWISCTYFGCFQAQVRARNSFVLYLAASVPLWSTISGVWCAG